MPTLIDDEVRARDYFAKTMTRKEQVQLAADAFEGRTIGELATVLRVQRETVVELLLEHALESMHALEARVYAVEKEAKTGKFAASAEDEPRTTSH